MNPFDFSFDRRALLGTLWLRLFGLRKIPLILYLRPSVIAWGPDRVVLKIPLRRRTKNQLGSMYFGALTTGADITGALLGLEATQHHKEPVHLVFKDLHAEFLKRAEGDVFFTCDDGVAIRSLVEKAVASGQREELPVSVVATVPDKLGNEPVARFTLTLSLKSRAKKPPPCDDDTKTPEPKPKAKAKRKPRQAGAVPPPKAPAKPRKTPGRPKAAK